MNRPPEARAEISTLDVLILFVLFGTITAGIVTGSPVREGLFGEGPFVALFAAGSAGLLALLFRYSDRVSRITQALLASAAVARAGALTADVILGESAVVNLLIPVPMWLLIAWLLVRGWNRYLVRPRPPSSSGAGLGGSPVRG